MMKNKQESKKVTVLKLSVCGALLALLITLTLYMVYLLNQSSRTQVPFALESITTEGSADDIDLSRYLLPEFIALSSGAEKRGISGSVNIMSEIYRSVSPIISEVISPENIRESDLDEWYGFMKNEFSLYIKYHSELPDSVIAIFADSLGYQSGTNERNTSSTYISEMLIIPNSDGSGIILIAAKSLDGFVVVYSAVTEISFTDENVKEMYRLYSQNMYTYDVIEGDPVFTESFYTKDIIMSTNATFFIQNEGENDIRRLLSFFALNPDKLLSSHLDEEGNGSYIDTHGIIKIDPSSFEYTSSSDGGIGIDGFVGHSGRGESESLVSYIKAAVRIIEFYEEMNKNYTGGDAEIFFKSVTDNDGVVTVSFMYAFDNIVISNISPAFTAVFENGILRSARLFTVSVRNLASRGSLLSEKLFRKYTENESITYKSTSLAYRGILTSDTIKAEWRGISELRNDILME